MTVGEAIQRQKEFVANKYHVYKYSNKELKESMKVLTKAYDELWTFLEEKHHDVLDEFLMEGKWKMEIEVEEYVRTKKGLIGKVNKIESAGSGVRFAGEFITDTIIQFNDGKVYEIRVKDKDIVKHSFNTTDLIEVGDVIEIHFPVRNTIRKIYVDEYFEDSMILNGIINGNVILKTILTKELYKANCYTVERRKKC